MKFLAAAGARFAIAGLALVLSAIPATAAIADSFTRPTAVFSHGVTVFEQQRQLAPKASLRYRVLAAGGHGAAVEVSLWMKGSAGRTMLQLGQDSSFNPTGLSAGQSIVAIPRGPAAQIAWRPDIRTQGLPPGSRRLGDLRLECLVDLKSGLNQLGDHDSCQPKNRKANCLEEMEDCLRGASLALLDQLNQFSRLQVEKSPYQTKPFHYLFIADQPVFSIQLAHGEQRLTLPAVWLYGSVLQPSPFFAWQYPREYLYSLPLDSADWPDDTLVIFDNMAKS
ncbi:hypothetical protein [Chromobacterium sphagni]|uniref:Uncharacterized protein n=1 Tax=Chromobacterium sphagni TaxID=1903179 RepID=A0ABX3CGE2_9NEIS|nr:hypothetical protein [Chromobacterium sphagni]OHX21408.1 hypothetical protein BI344_02440 [Chromobacterium sphagni]